MATAPARPGQANVLQIAAFVAIFVVVANVMFYVLSWMYFDDKAKSAAALLDPIDSSHEMAVRVQFAIFSIVVGTAAFLAAAWPRIVGHVIPALVGVGTLIAAGASYMKDLPIVLPVTLFLLGVLMPLLAWKSFVRARAAWSFLFATCLVYATCLFFGAPKVRTLIHVDLYTALILPGLLVVAALALNAVADHYKD
jgi:hypothetical protein